MKFFFVHDYKHSYRYFSSEPIDQIQVNFSRLRKIWEEAKKKFILLFPKILLQEQAFARTPKTDENKVTIVISEQLIKKRERFRFRFFLRRKKTSRILLIVGETLLLPISGLAMFLPGPNVFFGINVLFIITHWNSIKGINRLLKSEYKFISSPLFTQWENAIKNEEKDKFLELIEKIEKEFQLKNTRKILWK